MPRRTFSRQKPLGHKPRRTQAPLVLSQWEDRFKVLWLKIRAYFISFASAYKIASIQSITKIIKGLWIVLKSRFVYGAYTSKFNSLTQTCTLESTQTPDRRPLLGLVTILYTIHITNIVSFY